MTFAAFTKDPDAVLDYEVTWAVWLTAVDDTIDTSLWIVPDGIDKDSDDHTDTTATVWLSGGTAGTDYDCVNRVTTEGGRTDDRTITIKVRDR